MIIKTLRAKIFIYFILTAAAITAAYGFFTYMMIMRDLDREMESRLFMAGRLIGGAINHADLKYLELKGKIYGSYAEKLSSLRDAAGVSNIIIINRDKKILLSLVSGEGDFYLNLDSFEINRAQKGFAASSPLYRGAGGKFYKTGYLPLDGGVLAVEASAVYAGRIKNYRVSLAVAGLVILVLAFVVSLFITTGITRSIRRLKAKAEAIARREFNKDIKVGGEEEIRSLAFTLESMEKELQSYIEEREKMATVGEFSSGVAHEIRNSLSSLSGYAELIREKTNDEKIKKYATDITVNAMKMSGFLNNFLDYTKEFKPGMQEITAVQAVENILEELPADVKNVIEKNYEAGGAVIKVDAYLLSKALYNIIMNAYQALDKKEKHITITVSKAGDKVKIKVADNGRGIPESLKAKIFQPFVTGRKEGTGLGLAISYRIIKEIHKGEIKVESAEGQGTEVTITI